MAVAAALSLDAFTEEVTAFLDGHATVRPDEEFRWGESDLHLDLFPEKTTEEDNAEVAAARAWRRTVFDAGLGWITGPVDLGGRGLPIEYLRRYLEVEARYDVPRTSAFGITYGMVAPTAYEFGTEEVRQAYPRGFYRGDILACQLFSEPGAGSDLAGVTTRAARDGDSWVVTGQKVWTSWAHHADVGLLLARTNSDAPKHRALTMFLVDMRQPGVDVRPLRQMTGSASFNEVFFDEARIPDSLRLGEVDEGWRVAIATLMHERAWVGGHPGLASVPVLLELVHHLGAGADPIVRRQVATIWMHDRVASLNAQRAAARAAAGHPPGPELSMSKLALTENLQRVTEVVGRILGPRLVADSGEWGTYEWSRFVLGVPGVRVAGGTDEIQRNIVAERVLGLPKEPSAR